METGSEQNSASSTKLNAVQQQLLQLFSQGMDDQELADIQNLLTAYYDKRLQSSFDKVWDEKGWDTSVFDGFLEEQQITQLCTTDTIKHDSNKRVMLLYFAYVDNTPLPPLLGGKRISPP